MTTMKKTLLAIAAAAALSLTVSGCSDSSASSLRYNAVLDQASQAEKAAVLQTLQELVNIETGTNDAIGIPQMGNYLEARLQALGATVVRHKAEAGVVGDNIVGTFQGSGTKSLLLMAHMDTVYTRGILASAPFKVEGDKAYGAGIADAKGGIAVILHSLGLLKAQNFSKFKTITVMFNTDEEKGSFGSRDLIQQLAASHDYVLSYEPSGLEEGFGTATSGIAYVQAVVHGKASHAGVAPEAGINALTEASALVLRTQDIQDKAKERGFNWTTMTAGGTATNIIPDKAVVNADVRYGKNEDLDLMKGMLDKAASVPHVHGATIDINLTRGRPAFNATDEGVKLIQKAITIYADVGGKSQMYTTRGGGGSDAAYAALSGKPVIEGLGLPGANYHSNLAEYVLTEPIARRLYLSAQLIADLGQGM